ncbi:hypothetical protein [Coleofasciculus sp. F4-SAH-05]|uniref:hypothetical protein n=1 Tax=Coleofasciculus sp. F4-SAH-05 TaxID=3069525 RepID=UPI0033052249
MRVSTVLALTLSTASLWGMPIAPIHAVQQADGTVSFIDCYVIPSLAAKPAPTK